MDLLRESALLRGILSAVERLRTAN